MGIDLQKLEQVLPTLSPKDRAVLERYLANQGIGGPDFTRGLFPEQQAFVSDPSPRVSACCGRRAGKTHAALRKICDVCMRIPRAKTAYIALNRPSAKKLFWRPLIQLCQDMKVEIKPHNTDLIATFPNGSTIEVAGAETIADIEKFRGEKYHLIIIDESASFKDHINVLVEEVLEPTLADYRGQLCAIGTPGARPGGYFFDVTHGDKKGYSFHHWTILQNPMVPQWAGDADWQKKAVAFLAEERAKKGWDTKSLVYRREWMGEWVLLAGDLLYHFTDNALVDEVPEALDGYCIGVDLGWRDYTAIVVVGYDSTQKRVFEVEAHQWKGMSLSEISKQLEPLMAKFDPERIVIDAAGEGKIVIASLAEEFAARWEVPVEAAHKSQKAAFIRLLDSDLQSGQTFLRANGMLKTQLKKLIWSPTYQREKEGQACDMHDAFLYAYRECKHWVGAPEAPGRTNKIVGDPQGFKSLEEKLLEQDDQTAVRDVYRAGPSWF